MAKHLRCFHYAIFLVPWQGDVTMNINMWSLFYSRWSQFLSVLPPFWRWVVVFLLVVFLIRAIVGLIKRSLIWLIILAVLVPASLPWLRDILTAVGSFLQKFL